MDQRQIILVALQAARRQGMSDAATADHIITYMNVASELSGIGPIASQMASAMPASGADLLAKMAASPMSGSNVPERGPRLVVLPSKEEIITPPTRITKASTDTVYFTTNQIVGALEKDAPPVLIIHPPGFDASGVPIHRSIQRYPDPSVGLVKLVYVLNDSIVGTAVFQTTDPKIDISTALEDIVKSAESLCSKEPRAITARAPSAPPSPSLDNLAAHSMGGDADEARDQGSVVISTDRSKWDQYSR